MAVAMAVAVAVSEVVAAESCSALDWFPAARGSFQTARPRLTSRHMLVIRETTPKRLIDARMINIQAMAHAPKVPLLLALSTPEVASADRGNT